MRRDLTLDLSKTAPFLKENELDYMEDLVKAAHEKIHNKTGAGNDFLGWVDLPINYDKAEFERIKAAAKKIQSDSEVLIVIGIGGSYLGARSPTPTSWPWCSWVLRHIKIARPRGLSSQ